MELKHKKSNEFIYSLHKNVEEYLCHKCKKEEVCYSINDIQYTYESGWNEAMKNQWISVEENTPNEHENVLVLFECDGEIRVETDVYLGDYFYASHNWEWLYNGEPIIAWMPIPSFDEILEANKDVLKRLKDK